MIKEKTKEILAGKSAKDIIQNYPYIQNYFDAVRIEILDEKSSIMDLLNHYPDDYFKDYGVSRQLLAQSIINFIDEIQHKPEDVLPALNSITILGGTNKAGEPENQEIVIKKGEIVCIVGPTGSGKSRLLEDIECLAQGDTPTERRILLNGQFPTQSQKDRLEHRMVAQLSQNMNFVIDLNVADFLALHARSRRIKKDEQIIKEIISCANHLAGEQFDESTPVTQLSGGQSRALMIADTALLSSSPIILIDEIENAGIDRKKAMEILVKKEKIILISTHDPILALLGDHRIVIEKGGIKEVIHTSSKEKENLEFLETVDGFLFELRNHIRGGRRIEGSLKSQLLDSIQNRRESDESGNES